MTEFERQMAARLQAMDFLLKALIRPNLAQMTAEDARETRRTLARQFSVISIPEDADGTVSLDEVQSMHRDAQHFLDRILEQADPHLSGAAE